MALLLALRAFPLSTEEALLAPEVAGSCTLAKQQEPYAMALHLLRDVYPCNVSIDAYCVAELK